MCDAYKDGERSGSRAGDTFVSDGDGGAAISKIDLLITPATDGRTKTYEEVFVEQSYVSEAESMMSKIHCLFWSPKSSHTITGEWHAVIGSPAIVAAD